MVQGYCSVCGQGDFVPSRCPGCSRAYCARHRTASSHGCVTAPSRASTDPAPRVATTPASVRALTQELVIQARAFAQRSISFALLLALCAGFLLQVVGGSLVGLATTGDTGAGANAVTGWMAVGPGLEGVALRPWGLLTSVFAHGTLVHLLVSCVFLYFLGPHVEARIGRRRTLTLFLGGAAISGAVQAIVFGAYAIGASGAILTFAGVLLVLAPRSSIFFFFLPMPAWLVSGILVAVDLASSPGALATEQFSRISNLAHLSGLGLGAVVAYRHKHPLPAWRLRRPRASGGAG